MTAAGTVAAHEVLLDSRDVTMQPRRAFTDNPGLYLRVLWQDQGSRSYAGLLHMEAGSSLPPHLHYDAVHHPWVVSGICTINGRQFGDGSYAFVPAGVEHGIQQAGRAGCVLFYLYLVQPATQPTSGSTQ